VAFAEGSLGDGATDIGIRNGGLILTLRLQSDSWVASGTLFDDQRQNIIDGLFADTAIPTGWNAIIRATLSVSLVERITAQIVNIGPLPAFPTYSIPTWENVTVTIPDAALEGDGDLVATPSFRITPFVVTTLAQVLGDAVQRSVVQVVPEVAIPDLIRRNVSEGLGRRKSPIFNFDTGRFELSENGVIDTDSGVKSLRNWIRKTLITQRGGHQIYDFDYGSDIGSLIGRDRSYVSARIENTIIEAIGRDPRIEAISIDRVVYDEESVEISVSISENIEGNDINQLLQVGVR
jgi:hypothetical protein